MLLISFNPNGVAAAMMWWKFYAFPVSILDPKCVYLHWIFSFMIEKSKKLYDMNSYEQNWVEWTDPNGKKWITSAFNETHIVKLHRHHVTMILKESNENQEKPSLSSSIWQSYEIKTRTIVYTEKEIWQTAHKANKFTPFHMFHFEFENISFVLVQITHIHNILYIVHVCACICTCCTQ